jgi:hypothetical protein
LLLVRGVTALLSAGALLLAPVVASAHDGVGAAYQAEVGRYLLYVYDGFTGAEGKVDYRLLVLDRRTEDPVYDVEPTAVAERDDGAPVTGTVEAFGNVFYLSLPNPYPGRWRVELSLTGPLGASSTTFRLHGVEPEAGGVPVAAEPREQGRSTGWLVGGIVIAVLAVGGLVAIRRRH